MVRRGLVSEDKCAAARAAVWAAESRPPSVVEHDPSSWRGPLETHHWTGPFSWDARDAGGEPSVLAFLPGEPGRSAVWAIAEQLLGPDLIRPGAHIPARETRSGGGRAVGIRTRGVYNILPGQVEGLGVAQGCHCEAHPFQLGVVAILDTVVPGGGGFHVWPRSHRQLWPALSRHYADPADRTDAYAAALDAIRCQPPFEFSGQAGDCIFWHNRLCHAAGENLAGDKIRMASLYVRAPTGASLDLAALPPCNKGETVVLWAGLCARADAARGDRWLVPAGSGRAAGSCRWRRHLAGLERCCSELRWRPTACSAGSAGASGSA